MIKRSEAYPTFMDTPLSTYPSLKDFGADVTQCAVTTLAVAVDFDAFYLQAVEEALGTGIVGAVTLRTHAVAQRIRLNQSLVSS